MEDEYKEAVTRFYELYHPLAKAYNLRIHTKFSIYEEGLIEIHQYFGEKRIAQVVKITEENPTMCYKMATKALEEFKKRMEDAADEVYRNNKERKIC